MERHTITIDLSDTAAAHDAVALIAPPGIATEFQSPEALEGPSGWRATVVAEPRTGQRAAVFEPPSPDAAARITHTFSSRGTALSADVFRPEGTALTTAAAELAHEARDIASRVGGGFAGIAAIVDDTSGRFDYADVPMAERWYDGKDAVPMVACAAGNCIDINTYLVAALRAAGYRTAYLTCYFFDDDPNGIVGGMHCWVRTEHDGVTQDWDIAHVKKAGRADASPALNPIPGKRFALAAG